MEQAEPLEREAAVGAWRWGLALGLGSPSSGQGGI